MGIVGPQKVKHSDSEFGICKTFLIKKERMVLVPYRNTRQTSAGNWPTSKSHQLAVTFSVNIINFRLIYFRFKKGVDFPKMYKSWEPEDRMDPRVFFSCPIVEKESNEKLKMPAVNFNILKINPQYFALQYLASVAQKCDFLILWLDCDREGENICFEVIGVVRNSMRQKNPDGEFMDRVFRSV
jgi:DNA topoisomerase-3